MTKAYSIHNQNKYIHNYNFSVSQLYESIYFVSIKLKINHQEYYYKSYETLPEKELYSQLEHSLMRPMYR